MSQELTLNQGIKRAGAFEKRVHEIDFLRGVLILIVLMDHLLNNFLLNTDTWYQITGNVFWHYFYNGMVFYWDSIARQIIRYICLIAFVTISGISCSFSRNNWKRAGEMLLVYAFLAVVTNFMQAWHTLGSDSVVIIDFNVIGVLAWSTLFYCFVQNRSWKGLLASGLCWLLFSSYGMDIIHSIPGTSLARVPALIMPTFQTGDWMPLVPYIGFFFIGVLIGYFVYADKKSKVRRFEWERPFCFVGRYTIYIYLGHQIILIPLFMAITAIMRSCYGM
ncbi:MAG: DUF1624 domain-containing protein [Bacilli bacterium]|nr:DUF1624 domain-containing protein [Bacilli bacterium]